MRMTMTKLKVVDDFGGQRQIGFAKSDGFVFHTIVRAPAGAPFLASAVEDHIAKCPICKEYGMTFAMFDQYEGFVRLKTL